jgi:UDP-N-acetylglucosamine--N-acetylmuramyl-(pentapeptide) pyrophosphoryl-undecaprenol N-acetylglucosamine transferase
MSPAELARPVLIMAGGTGGHVMPGLAVAHAMQARGERVLWLGSKAGMEAKLVAEHELHFHPLDIGGVRGKGLFARIAGVFKLMRATWQARSLLKRERPRCALSFGGFASGPGGLAAVLCRVPLLVHEQNAIAGLTNKVLARFARRVLTAFDGALPRSERVGNPVRAAIAEVGKQADQRKPGALRILVLGGSLGAQALNENVPKALAKLPVEARPEVLHQSGSKGIAFAQQHYRDAGVIAEVVPFISDMASAYANADLLICRAGASTIAELCAAARHALLVPYPHAVDDHQTANARWLQQQGSAEVLAQAELTPEVLLKALAPFLSNPQSARTLGARNRALHPSDSAARIADIALEVSR